MIAALALTAWLGVAFMLVLVVLNDLHNDGGIRVDGAAVFLVVVLSLAWPFILPVLLLALGRRKKV